MTENLSANQEAAEELEREDITLRDAKSIVAAFGETNSKHPVPFNR